MPATPALAQRNQTHVPGQALHVADASKNTSANLTPATPSSRFFKCDMYTYPQLVEFGAAVATAGDGVLMALDYSLKSYDLEKTNDAFVAAVRAAISQPGVSDASLLEYFNAGGYPKGGGSAACRRGQ
jgi:hypothetical protein